MKAPGGGPSMSPKALVLSFCNKLLDITKVKAGTVIRILFMIVLRFQAGIHEGPRRGPFNVSWEL